MSAYPQPLASLGSQRNTCNDLMRSFAVFLELLSNVVERHDQAATFWCVSSRSICSPLLN